jgi:hypothetical protein
MSSVAKQSGNSQVYATSTPSQIEEQKPAETKSEPEKQTPQNPSTTPTPSKDRTRVDDQAKAGQFRAEQLRSQLASSSNNAIENIQQNFQNKFTTLSNNQEQFHALMKEVYGSNYNAEAAESFRMRTLKGDFSWLPKIEIRDDRTLKGANGAFEESRNVVHINEKLLNRPEKAAQVYSEEVGHFLDTKIKTTDTPGDEGEMFRRLLAGEKLTDADKAHIRADNDHGAISINGKSAQVEFDNSAVDVGPQVNLSPEANKRWEALNLEMMLFQQKLGRAHMQNNGSPTRAGWINELQNLQMKMGQVSTQSELADIQAAYTKFEKKVFESTAKADEEWHIVEERFNEEQGRLMEESSVGGAYALDESTKLHNKIKQRMDNIDNDFRAPEDYQDLKTMLDTDKHLWLGELNAARGRVKELRKMLDVVGTLRSAGQDEDKMIPGWNQRVRNEMNRLEKLAASAPSQEDRIEFQREKKDLDDSWTRALDSKPRKKSVGEKGFDLVSGAISAVTDPIIEAGKQYIDLQQIALHYATLTNYEPRFISDLSKAAEKGAKTSDMLKDMAKGMIETPERFLKAVQDGDWNGIGKETVNLYFLAKTGKEGAVKAASMLRLAKARAAGLEGGMSAAAALETLKIAKNEGVIIRYRMNEPSTIKLREAGHPAKPEALKMKTIKEVDTHLGASTKDLGKVGYFEPKLPSDLSTFNTKFQAEIKARYDARMKEWTKYKAEVNDLIKRGVIKHEGNLIVDPKTGKAFTGDYDLFDIRRRATGKSVEFEQLPKDIQDRMKGKPIEAQHGAHLDWKEIPAGSAEIFAEIILAARPRPGAKPLIEFHPDGKIRYTYFTD